MAALSAAASTPAQRPTRAHPASTRALTNRSCWPVGKTGPSPRRYAEATQQEGLDRFRHAVSADLVGAEARHQSDDQASNDRNQQRPISKVMMRGRDEVETPALVVKKICEEADETQQDQSDIGTGDPDHNRESGDGNDARRYREIPEKSNFFPAADSVCELTKKSPEFRMRCFFRYRYVHARNLTRLERRSGCKAATNLRPELCSSSTWRAANSRAIFSPLAVKWMATRRRSLVSRLRVTRPCSLARSRSSTML